MRRSCFVRSFNIPTANKTIMKSGLSGCLMMFVIFQRRFNTSDKEKYITMKELGSKHWETWSFWIQTDQFLGGPGDPSL